MRMAAGWEVCAVGRSQLRGSWSGCLMLVSRSWLAGVARRSFLPAFGVNGCSDRSLFVIEAQTWGRSGRMRCRKGMDLVLVGDSVPVLWVELLWIGWCGIGSMVGEAGSGEVWDAVVAAVRLRRTIDGFDDGSGWLWMVPPWAENGGFHGCWAWALWAWIVSVCCLALVVCFYFCLLVGVLVFESVCRFSNKSFLTRVKVVVVVEDSHRWCDLSGCVAANGTQFIAGLMPCVSFLACVELAGRSWDGPPNSSLLWFVPVPVVAIYFGQFSSTIHLIRLLLLDLSTCQSFPLSCIPSMGAVM